MTSMPHSHPARSPHKEPPAHAPNAALLIDFDNVTMGIRSDLQSELKRLLQSDIIRGRVAVQRAYADWRRYPQYIVPLSESSIDLIFAPAYGSNKKNATDIRLAVDATELVFTRPEIGTFILLSGDSDFSSLVIKLKEHGKYVIGVGIRESSSDLLIQNCDEYYSYNELAGLTRTTDVHYERRDPWQLVIEAVKQMTAHNDVMRSDRLKQVMQELDPNFDEKDTGFSRFSKFVLEAQKRGLITLTRLDNGQYEIALGPESGGAPAAAPAGGAPERAPERAPRSRAERPARGERPERGEHPEKPAAGGRRGGFSLGEAFGLLKQALGRVGTSEPVAAEDLREAMVELKGESGESLTPSKFPRLLRQAHDAEIIDLSKEEDGGYQVRLRAEGAEAPAGEVREPGQGPGGPAAAEPAAGPARSPRFRRGSRGPRQAPPPEVKSIGVVEVEPGFRPPAEPAAPLFRAPAPDVELPAGADTMPRHETGEMSHPRDGRSIRGRRGSRGRGSARPAGAEPVPGAPRLPEGGPRGDRPPEHRAPREDRPPRDDRPPRGEGRGRGGDRERGGDGERSRGRRRGGRGRGGREGREGFDGRDSRAREGRDGRGPHDRGPIERAEPLSSPEAVSPPPPPPRPREPAPEIDGESFWTRVKRGLIGE
jgi:uncharacterized protein (TIGR00288 family)